MALDTAGAVRAVRAQIAEPLGMTAIEAATGVVRIADSAMALAVRAVSVRKGVDPRDAAMIAFGGAGPVHAAALCKEIYIPTLVIPKLPGNFSALGPAPSTYLKRMHTDTVSPHAPGVRFALDFYGVDHIMYGSYYPCWMPEAALQLLEQVGLSPADQQQVMYSNAHRILCAPAGAPSRCDRLRPNVGSGPARLSGSVSAPR